MRRVREAPARGAGAVCGAGAVLLAGSAALLGGSSAFLGVSCWRDTGYATSSAFWANSVSVG